MHTQPLQQVIGILATIRLILLLMQSMFMDWDTAQAKVLTLYLLKTTQSMQITMVFTFDMRNTKKCMTM